MGLVEQIRSEQKRLGWSTQQLLDKSGLRLERSSLQRKLTGDTPITSKECEALASALGIQLVWPIEERVA